MNEQSARQKCRIQANPPIPIVPNASAPDPDAPPPKTEADAPRRSAQTPPVTPRIRRLLTGSGVVFLTALILAVLDAVELFRLPQPLRSFIPWLLVGSALLGITLLVSLLGTPSRSGRSAGSDAEQH